MGLCRSCWVCASLRSRAKCKISAKSTVDGKELSQYIKENSAKGLTEEQVNNLIKNSQVITDLQNQVDGAIETWFYEGVPTLTNAPASSWTTDKDKDTHLGDLYYDNKYTDRVNYPKLSKRVSGSVVGLWFLSRITCMICQKYHYTFSTLLSGRAG